MDRYDYIIVGQGITGSVMALTLMKHGKSFAVIDQPRLSSSSKMATGIYNPFNFRQLMNNWRAKEMSEALNTLYAYAEEVTGDQLHESRRLLKVFSSADERRLWEQACVEKRNLYADELIIESAPDPVVHAPHGVGLVHGAGKVDCGILLYGVREKLRNSGNYYEEQFDCEQLEFNNDLVSYAGAVQAKRIIFCEGHLTKKNKWFGGVPIRPAKGELLHVHIPGFHTNDIYTRGCSLVPMGNELFNLGSTFANDSYDESTTEKAKQELLEKAQKFINAEIQVVSQYAGIRPAVQDRRTVVGIHPHHPQLAILNGMGSKAVFLAPWLAEQLLLQMEEGKELPVEVNAKRYIK